MNGPRNPILEEAYRQLLPILDRTLSDTVMLIDSVGLQTSETGVRTIPERIFISAIRANALMLLESLAVKYPSKAPKQLVEETLEGARGSMKNILAKAIEQAR